MDVNFNELLRVVLRALLSLVTLFLVTKMLGKKQVSQLSLFDYVIGISIGNFAAEMTINLESHFLNGTVAVVIFGLVAYLISILTMKSILLRRYFMGVPTVLIDNGVLLEGSLKKVKYDINDLLEQCRELGYFDISDISYAIMEANGQVSILPKDKARGVTIEDMGIKDKKVGLCANVIIDGKVMKKNLENIGKDEKWLKKQIKSMKKEIDNILLATVDVNSKVNVYEKNDLVDNGVLE